MTWTVVTNTTFGDYAIYDIAYGNGTFVVGGYDGKMAYSTDDGKTWIAVDVSGIFGSNSIEAIAFGGGTFVAGDRRGKMAYSTNGVAWTAVANSTFDSNNNIVGIAFGDNTFVAVSQLGEMAYSKNNGETWTAVTDSGIWDYFDSYDNSTRKVSINDIAYGNGKFVAGGGDRKMAYSSDGVTWTKIEITPQSEKFNSIGTIAFGNGRFVASDSYSYTIMGYSTDGITWTTVKNADDNTTMAIAYGENKFVAVGTLSMLSGSGYRTSINGTTWTTVSGISGLSNAAWAITYGNGIWVTGGQGGKMAYSTGN